jgi:hypothetical protein
VDKKKEAFDIGIFQIRRNSKTHRGFDDALNHFGMQEGILAKIDVLPLVSRAFIKKLSLDILDVKRLTNDGKLLFLIRTSTHQYVLKVNSSPTGLKSKIRFFFLPSLGFRKECLFYQTVNTSRSQGHYAEYYSSDKHNILIGLLPKKNILKMDLDANHCRLIGNTLAMFHWETTIYDNGLLNFVHRCIYGVPGMAFRVGIPTVKKILGIRASIRFAYEIIKCIRNQPKLPRTCLSHNDFLPNNLIFTENAFEIFIIDFQDITDESRWPFYDLIRLLLHLKGIIEPSLEKEIINSYLEKVPSDIIKSINIENQIRFCLLKSLIHNIQWGLNNNYDSSEIVDYLKLILCNGELEDYSELIEIFKRKLWTLG